MNGVGVVRVVAVDVVGIAGVGGVALVVGAGVFAVDAGDVAWLLG